MHDTLIPTDGIHGVWRELKDAVEYEGAALKKDVTPVPPIIFYDVVRLGFHPEVECD